MARIWIEEPGDKRVWHLAVNPPEKLRSVAACGWIMDFRRGLIWPEKTGRDPGPPTAERCHTCVAHQRAD